ncbi:MAG: site-specific DNA-methyltransferase [Candidatus Omnitrophota bacterium]
MPTLNWIGKEKIVNHDKEVSFRLLKKNKRLSLGESENLIVEGDNLEALKALMPFYHGQVKCIYIDPPYNTGNEKWVYNDKVNSSKIKEWLGKAVGPEGEDLTRHDKWLCMMYPRLKLLRDLLSEDGVIFVSIDDSEHCNLKQIMDEIFGVGNFITNIIWQKAYSPVNLRKLFSPNHDFILCYAKKISVVQLNQLPRTEESKKRYKNPDNDSRGPWKSTDLSVGPAVKENIYEITTPKGRKVLPPKGRSWVLSKKRFQEFLKDNRIWFGASNNSVPSIKKFISEVKIGMTPLTIWLYQDVGHNQDAKKEIKVILQEELPFETPKPTYLMKRILQIATKPGDIVLDSFSGSGTTGHAVLELNKEDGGTRKFILVEMEKDICRDITAERIRRVAKGYSYKKDGGEVVKVKGLGGGFEYVELGETLFNSNGMINESVSFVDMANYIFFTETHTNLDKNKIKVNYIGEFADTYYFLLFDGIGKNVLDRSFLKELKAKVGKKIVYADKCLLGEEVLEKHQIIFKQIPYRVKVY